MAQTYDLGDLADANEVAGIIGLSNSNGVSVYQRRYVDFPTPVVKKGRCVLWSRKEVAAWQDSRSTDR